MAKYLLGASGIGLGTAIKYRAQCSCEEPEFPLCVLKKNPLRFTFSFASAAQNNIPLSKKKRPASRKLVPPSLPSLRLKEPQCHGELYAHKTRYG
jgi:hypothetical protein